MNGQTRATGGDTPGASRSISRSFLLEKSGHLILDFLYLDDERPSKHSARLDRYELPSRTWPIRYPYKGQQKWLIV